MKDDLFRSAIERSCRLAPSTSTSGRYDAAAELIPPDSTYYVNVGQDFPFSHEVTRATVTPFAGLLGCYHGAARLTWQTPNGCSTL